MSPELIGLISVIALFVLLFSGIHIALAFLLVSLIGSIVLMGIDVTLSMWQIIPPMLLANFSFAVLPFFILMGLLSAHSGLAESLYNSLHKWAGKLPGGLAMATAAAQAGFGAASGSSLASAVAFTKISLPPMLSRGYDRKLATGTIAAAGILAVLIPPSALVVIYGIIAEQPISPLLIAGVFPGLLAALGFMGLIFIRVKLNPSIAPVSTEQVPWKEKFSSLKGVWTLLILILIVIGGIYFGVFTPTEAGAAGCFGAFLIALQQRRLGGGRLKSALLDALSVTAMVFFILTAALIFGRFLAVTRLPDAVLEFIQGSGWPPIAIVICFLGILLIMGMFLEAMSALVLSTPIMIPTIEALGYDGVWFGILVVYTLAIGFVTPPMGMVAFAVKGAAGGVVTTGEVFKGVTPFIIVAVVLLALLVAFPQISLVLPNLMK